MNGRQGVNNKKRSYMVIISEFLSKKCEKCEQEVTMKNRIPQDERNLQHTSSKRKFKEN